MIDTVGLILVDEDGVPAPRTASRLSSNPARKLEKMYEAQEKRRFEQRKRIYIYRVKDRLSFDYIATAERITQQHARRLFQMEEQRRKALINK